MLNVLITGGTGFVGKHLVNELIRDHHVYILTRSPDSHFDTKNRTYLDYQCDRTSLPVIHAVVNLAGESLYGYWSKKKKERILSSRIETTQWLIDFMEQLDKKPEVFISGSAVGFYGTSNDIIFTEETTTPGDDFLASVVLEWEKTASKAEKMGIRTVYSRFGVILGNGGGALPFMQLPVKIFAGGRIGKGDQWISWVHMEDAVNLILFCLRNEHIEGPINITSPNPKRNSEFTRILANVLKRPYWLPTPSPLLRVGIGEMSHLITKGQFVLPKKAETNNYQFAFPFLEEALRQIQR